MLWWTGVTSDMCIIVSVSVYQLLYHAVYVHIVGCALLNLHLYRVGQTCVYCIIMGL